MKKSLVDILYQPNVLEVQLMMIASKALYCLECSLDRNGYLVAFRESEGISTVSIYLELFAYHGLDIKSIETIGGSVVSPIDLNYSSKCVLEGALNLLNLSLLKSKHVLLHGGTAESGVQIAYNPYFSVFCHRVFVSQYNDLESVWKITLQILREMVEMEPAYLAVFLTSTSCAVLKTVFSDGKFPAIFAQSSGKVASLLLPLCKFAQTMCITIEGRQFLAQSKMVEFAVDAIQQPCVLYPASYGMSIDKLNKIGKTIAQIIVDSEAVKLSVKSILRERLKSLCGEASREWSNLPLQQDPALNTPRMQILQKLSNVCTLIEGMFVENKTRHNSELMRDVLSEPVIESLMDAYICTLPPSNQLFTQLSIKDSLNFGFITGAKSITNLLKIAAHSLPNVVLPIIDKHIDRTLENISSSKQSLLSIGSSHSYDSEDGHRSQRGSERRKSRSSSMGSSSGANVFILGVLDYIPHSSVVDPNFRKDISANSFELQNHISKFLTSILMLEWLSIMLSNALRSVKAQSGNTSNIPNRDVLRRLFAFHRSSMLEVCRFASKKLVPKVCNHFVCFILFSVFNLNIILAIEGMSSEKRTFRIVFLL